MMSKGNGKRHTKKSAGRAIKIIVEKHADGYVGYPLGLKGVVVGDDTISKRRFSGRRQRTFSGLRVRPPVGGK